MVSRAVQFRFTLSFNMTCSISSSKVSQKPRWIKKQRYKHFCASHKSFPWRRRHVLLLPHVLLLACPHMLFLWVGIHLLPSVLLLLLLLLLKHVVRVFAREIMESRATRHPILIFVVIIAFRNTSKSIWDHSRFVAARWAVDRNPLLFDFHVRPVRKRNVGARC